MSWATSYPIPIRQNSTGTQKTLPVAVKMGNEFWIFCQTVYTNPYAFVSEVFVFHTDTHTMRKVKIIEFGNLYTGITQFTAKNHDQIYLWKENISRDSMVLCKFDIKTRVMSRSLTVSNKGLYHYTPIIGDIMYALFHDEDDKELTLKIINLSANKVMREVHLKKTENETIEHGLLVNNGKLYVLEFDEKIGIRIYEFKNELMLLSEQKFDATVEEIIEIYAREDGVHYGVRQNGTKTFYCYKFDFEQKKWKKEASRQLFELGKFCVKDEETIDGITYTTIMRPLSNLTRFDVRVFEELPKLSTVCYLNIVDELMKTDDLVELERIKQLLPSELSRNLSNMMKWRLEEKEDERKKKLKEEQKEKVIHELKAMMDDGTIDEDIFAAIDQCFATDGGRGIP